jgi:hypothetical protein
VAEKIDRKQLRRPDEFQVVAGRAMGWVAAHQRLVLGVASAVVVVVLIAWGVSAWRDSRESKASAELAEALELLSRPVAGDGQAQAGEQTFPSKEEREKAVVSALEKVRSDHGSTAAGQTALAELGFHKLKSGDAAAAQKDLGEFLARARKDHPLRPFAQEALGYALEAQGKLDEARGAFERLREMGVPARADYQSARLALVQGKPDAKQQLERVAKEYPKDLAVVREANERLELASLPPYTPGEAAPAPRPGAKAEAEKTPQGKKKR